eukprot:COSAG06_NODE_5237_length_3619_cov_2.313920_2_plen_171_part_00
MDEVGRSSSQAQTEDVEAGAGEKDNLTGSAESSGTPSSTDSALASTGSALTTQASVAAAKEGLKKYLLVMSLLLVLLLEAFGIAVLVAHWTDIHVPGASVSRGSRLTATVMLRAPAVLTARPPANPPARRTSRGTTSATATRPGLSASPWQSSRCCSSSPSCSRHPHPRD